ncbi:MAG: bifunctional DNA-formamidopyrimidine glycosylase/DNA-(apurinic or apyrimidinic site) lyase [Ilumatobacteraceae bacterium]|nr:bifunctional DNA-formamidopyrimidine glycosylase/DNA-(apurinic or apyrimidinic site) lyase [Ilumatobacteraceae bacterium]
MPELPEVETVRRGMESFVVGRRIERVEVGRERTVRRTSRESLIDGLTGATITSIGRRGKYILCSLDTGDALMIHLRMSGRVLVSEVGSQRPDHTHVVLHLAGAPERELWFVDPRTFGEMVVFDPDRVETELPELAKLGIDPITDGLSVAQLTGILRSRARQLKPLLLDQHVIAGIGNIYCDEILHRAKLRPDRLANTIKPAEIRRLHEAIHSILNSAIEAGGSTLSDTQYVDVMGDGGSFQLDHRVYDRAGQRCLTCGKATIVRTVSGGRSTCYCPRCQR